MWYLVPEEAAMRMKLGEIARVFLRLGFTAFGGPAAHVALMHGEFVDRRRWVSEQEFLDMLGTANLIPGPTSTETALFLGYARASWAGLVTSGVCFIAPAMLLVMALSWAYVKFGTAPAAGWLLYGTKPVIIAIILQAFSGLAKRAVKGPLTAAAAAAVLVLYLLQVNEILLLLGGGLIVMVVQNRSRLRSRDGSRLALFAPALGLAPLTSGVASASRLFWVFLKIGSVLYGGGYVLFALLRADFVSRLGWLTDRQLVDAIAVGQVTPGPLFTSATFIGYLVRGPWGAIVSTVGIFLPAFVFAAICSPFIGRIRQSSWAASFLDGVNATALGLMAAVTFKLGLAAFPDAFAIGLGAVALLSLLRFKLNPTWLILGGGLAGLAVRALS
jgi:chromate transporter